MKRFLALGALVGAVVAVVLVVVGGDGDDRYAVKLRLENAGGLRDGSPVVVGGVTVGDVKLDAARDSVTAELRIDDKYAPLGRDATAALLARNAIGQKTVKLSVGDRTANPAPDGYVVPARQIQESTDLDQLLSTLDPDTRTRLAILLNEAGTAFAGREMDFRRLLAYAPLGLDSGSRVLGQLARDNRALENLVTTSDRYVATLAAERRRIARMFDVLGQTTETVAARRAELGETLHRAPAALSSARSFLAELRRTTGPLGSTARLLTATAPSVRTALERIEPFRQTASPLLVTLREEIAPAITRLNPSGETYYRARETLDLLRAASEDEVPRVGRTLDRSMDNVLATMDNWSRAIQFRDRMGHVFRGEGTVSPDIIDSLIARLTGQHQRREDGSRSRERTAAPRPQAEGQRRQAAPSEPRRGERAPADRPAEQVNEQVQQLLDDLATPTPESGGDSRRLAPLLDYLFG